jgi:Uma2 family endonuclease
MPSVVTVYPRTRRWTRKEYDGLIALGVFQPDERLELLDGLLAVREPQGSRHAAAIRCVVEALRRALGESWQIDSQLPVALDDYSEPEPDVAVVPLDPNHYRDDHPSQPLLVVEVAESSYLIDHNYKAGLYARAGVPDYWIVDTTRESLEVHRDPQAASAAVHGFRYGTVDTLGKSATVTPLLAPTIAIRVADLLP